MATIRKRGSSYQVQVRREGYHPLSKTFASTADAAAWARDQERTIDRSAFPVSIRELKNITVADLLRRYCETVTPNKRGASPERYRIRTLLTHSLAQVALSKLSPAAVAHYRDDRLKRVQPGTARRELAILRRCFEIARREWRIAFTSNPVRQITLPETAEARDRRLEATDDKALGSALAATSAWHLRPLITLAIETGMRRGELLSIRWKDVDLAAPTIRILTTKNGHPRPIPLTPKAVEVLATLDRTDERVFPVTLNAVRLAWERLRKRAGLEDLRFHDPRHEAVSRFFEYGLTVPEIALISDHRDPRMLDRYTRLRPEKVAESWLRLLPNSSSTLSRGPISEPC